MLKVANSVINVSQITGVLPVVNGGTGVTTSTGTGNTVLSATPTLSGDVTLSTGNLVIGTAGKGIDFSADPSTAGMTSELLDDYEEGTWTPVATSQGGSLTAYTSSGTYTKVGRLVYLSGNVLITTTGTATGVMFLAGYPFTNGSATLSQLGSANEVDLAGLPYQVRLTANVTTGFISAIAGGAIVWTAGGNYVFSLVYYAT